MGWLGNWKKWIRMSIDHLDISSPGLEAGNKDGARMRVRALVSSFVFLVVLALWSPSSVWGSSRVAWEKNYYTIAHSRRIVPTHDGGFLVSGLKNSSMLVFKIDVEGGIVWSKTYAGKGHTEPYDMIESGDGGFVILAYTEAFGITDHGLYIVSIDAEGNTTWERTYPDVPTAWGITGNRIAWSGPDYIVLWGCEALEADR